MLIGQRETLRASLAAARRGAGAALLVRDEPGLGPRAVLGLPGAAAGFRVVRVPGSRAVPAGPWSGLHQLCAQLLDQVERLATAQREVLRAAFGPSAASPDPSAAGLTLFTLLAHAAEQRPVLCVFQDAQWLDPLSRQALATAARRVATEPVVLWFVVPAAGAAPEYAGLPRTPEVMEALS